MSDRLATCKWHEIGIGVLVMLIAGACTSPLSRGPGTGTGSVDAPVADGTTIRYARTDGIFTRGQAFRGERRFQQVCAACHQTAEITRLWLRAGMHETAADFFTRISTTMPDGNPGSLMASDYADIMAFVLRANDFPEGEDELPADPARLEQLLLRAR